MVKDLILITTNSGHGSASFHAVHGGETLLGRALVAASKSGMETAYIVGLRSDASLLNRLIDEVRHRLTLRMEFCLIDAATNISATLEGLAHRLSGTVMMVDADKILHPSFLGQAVQLQTDKPTAIAYDHVTLVDGAVQFSTEIRPKFQVIFRDTGHYPILSKAGNNWTISKDARNGLLSTGVLICRTNLLRSLPTIHGTDDLIAHFGVSGKLAVECIGNSWWLQLSPTPSSTTLNDFFWGIAFKDISGEFSKAVNSKLSKPLTFLLVRRRVAPDSISRISLLFYFIATAFLFVPYSWGLYCFAVLWQFSAGVLDRCDGETARMRNYESNAGADFDVLVDDLRFFLPLAVLGSVCFIEREYDLVSLTAASIALVSSFTLAFREVRAMRSLGYRSRQIMAGDIVNRLQPGTGSTKWFHFFRPFFKGDIRTFYIFLLCFSGIKVVVLWGMILNAITMGILSLATIMQLNKMKRTPAA